MALLLLAGERTAAAEEVAVQDPAGAPDAVQDTTSNKAPHTTQALPAIAVTEDDGPARASAKRPKPARTAAS
ncbi:MAG: hypothetical protein P4M07_01330, partial [Xanthobacteraceae bacterium]|nr:hypothetical protein [Xanthobacteraceae bacterium]